MSVSDIFPFRVINAQGPFLRNSCTEYNSKSACLNGYSENMYCYESDRSVVFIWGLNSHGVLQSVHTRLFARLLYGWGELVIHLSVLVGQPLMIDNTENEIETKVLGRRQYITHV